MCIARTDGVPANTEELSSLTSLFGKIVVPYSVWSYKRGAGREIVNQVLLSMKRVKTVSRVITLSPLTDMARNFHLRNSAFELRVNETTVNFEYIL
jgi:hypothetical protein